MAEYGFDPRIVRVEAGPLREQAPELLLNLGREHRDLVFVQEQLHPLAGELDLVFAAPLPVTVGAAEADTRPVSLARFQKLAGERLAEVVARGMPDLDD